MVSLVPYAKSSEEDDRSLATAVKRETEEDSDVNEQEKPKQEVEIAIKEDEGMTESETEDEDSPSEAEIEPTETTVQAKIKHMARKKRNFKRLGLPPPKKQREVDEEKFKARDVFEKQPRATSPPQPVAGTTSEEHQDLDVIELGSIRLPRIGYYTSETSYETLVDTAQVLQKLTHVVQRLINNQSQEMI